MAERPLLWRHEFEEATEVLRAVSWDKKDLENSPHKGDVESQPTETLIKDLKKVLANPKTPRDDPSKHSITNAHERDGKTAISHSAELHARMEAYRTRFPEADAETEYERARRNLAAIERTANAAEISAKAAKRSATVAIISVVVAIMSAIVAAVGSCDSSTNPVPSNATPGASVGVTPLDAGPPRDAHPPQDAANSDAAPH